MKSNGHITYETLDHLETLCFIRHYIRDLIDNDEASPGRSSEEGQSSSAGLSSKPTGTPETLHSPGKIKSTLDDCPTPGANTPVHDHETSPTSPALTSLPSSPLKEDVQVYEGGMGKQLAKRDKLVEETYSAGPQSHWPLRQESLAGSASYNTTPSSSAVTTGNKASSGAHRHESDQEGRSEEGGKKLHFTSRR